MRKIQRQSEAYTHTAMPAPPGHLNDQWKSDLMQTINDPDTGGGFTTRDYPGDGPQTGYMVSLPKSEGHEEQNLRRDQVNGDNQADYMDRKWDLIHSQPDLYGGGWDEGGPWYNDVSKKHDDLFHADKDAFQGDQKALFDNTHKRSIDTDEAGWMTGAPWITGGQR